MTPYALGQQLRVLVLRDRQAGLAVDVQRLQAAVSDLCGAEHSDLVAPLRYLILSAPFASAAGQDPPLAGRQLLPRLQNELAQMFAAPICTRLQPVLEGLLGLPAAAESVPTPPMNTAPAPAPAAPAAPPVRAGTTGTNGVLLLLCGALLLALGGLMGLWLQQRPRAENAPAPASVPAPIPPTTAPPQVAPDQPTAAPQETAVPEIPPPPAPASMEQPTSPNGNDAEAVRRSQVSVERLVASLSRKDFASVQPLIAPEAADQFDATFYGQFASVAVEDLRPTGQRGSLVDLEGVMVFRWPDGSRQRESRRFTVDSGSDPPRIVSSDFGRVLQAR